EGLTLAESLHEVLTQKEADGLDFTVGARSTRTLERLDEVFLVIPIFSGFFLSFHSFVIWMKGSLTRVSLRSAPLLVGSAQACFPSLSRSMRTFLSIVSLISPTNYC